MRSRRRSSVTRALALLSFSLAATLATSAPAFAAGPRWQFSARTLPTHLAPEANGVEGKGEINLVAWNLGGPAAAGEGVPVTITDNLPQGLTATAIQAWTSLGTAPTLLEPMQCSSLPTQTPTCTWSKALAPHHESLTSYGYIEVRIQVGVKGPARTLTNEARVEGGEAPAAAASEPVTVSGTPAPFGFERYEQQPENEDGSLDTQAGSHPFQLTSTVTLNSAFEAGSGKPEAMARDVRVDLPPGLVGDETAIPRCTSQQFKTITQFHDLCPADTAVGVVLVTVREEHNLGAGPDTRVEPLFNLTPAPGEPARLGFVGVIIPIVLDTSVRSGGDYGVTVSSENTLQTAELLASRVTVWGFPGDQRHNASRGTPCLYSVEFQNVEPCLPVTTPQAFLTLPGSCASPFASSAEGDSWPQTVAPGVTAPPEVAAPLRDMLTDGTGQPLDLGGCDSLPFSPALNVAPETNAASSPTGVSFDVNVPQETTLDANAVAEADVRDTSVTLPAGVQLNPSAANGLQSCSRSQIGYTGVNPQSGADEFTPAASSCPEQSKIATVSIKTPLLANQLKGEVYLAAPQNFAGPPEENPFDSLVAVYLVAQDPVSGVLVKLAGRVTPDPVSGQLVTTFENTPQLPFEELEVHFFGGDRAPLSTPPLCGTYTTQASFTPWSGTGTVTPSSSFPIATGPNGSPCPGQSLPFAPSLTAGTTGNQAGAFSPFTTTMSRADGQQDLQAISLTTPPGLSGLLAGVKLCGEAQGNAGTCGPDSEIGETTVSVGVGNEPFTVKGGKVYITGPYQGAPFGLSIVTPAVAGPFDLGNVVVRARIEVNPITAALTITSDNAGPYKIPTILDGIPLHIRDINVTITRPGFTFNPTSCNKLAIGANLSAAEGATEAVSVPFQVTNCATLGFKPRFTVSTSGKTSKANGASLNVKLSFPNTPQGSEANIHSVKVDLPKQLPSRLTTLQQACTAKQFEANPAGCPAASVVGHAKAITPLLPVPVEGPAYFVSHGGEAFPSLILVLQGYGVTVDLVGTTFISKAGITSSTFKTVPDVPVSRFELDLPRGHFSALTANGSLCKPIRTVTAHKLVAVRVHGRTVHVRRTVKRNVAQALAMPTAFTAQNGAVLKQSTKIAVTGCARKVKKKAKKASSSRHGQVKTPKKR